MARPKTRLISVLVTDACDLDQNCVEKCKIKHDLNETKSCVTRDECG